MYRKYFKNIVDLFFAISTLFVLAPLMLITLILIKSESKGPIFFKQKRLGANKKPFEVIKFRTMIHKERVLSGQVYKDNPEITRIGYYLRRYKIDEFPQLFNLLKGEMSIVGPRPCLPAIIENYDLENSTRFNVKPGLTSIAGVNGSIYLSWKEKWWYDEYYVDNLSFLLDIKIIFKTIAVVILGEEKFLNKPKMDHHGNS